jgi:hypothetical protein
MTTYATMRTRILDEMVNESLTTAQVNAAIQSSIAHYQRMRFYFNESRAETFVTVASQEFYGTSDNTNIPNLSKIDRLVISVNGTRYPLTVENWEWFENMSSTTTALGQPTEYCYYAQQLRLYPIPDGAYTVRISGLVRFAALSADGDSNAWMTDGETLIRGRSKWDLAMNVCYSPEIESSAAELEASALRALNSETVRRISSRLSGYL